METTTAAPPTRRMISPSTDQHLRRCGSLLSAAYDDLAVAASEDPEQTLLAELAGGVEDMLQRIKRARA